MSGFWPFSKKVEVDERYERYRKFVDTLIDVTRIGKQELEAARQKNGKLEQLVDDECKRALFSDFARGKVTNEYADGYLTALAVRKHLTYPDWDERSS